MSASKFKADHLIGILDNNGVQLDGTLEDIMPMGDIRAKWEAFGWNVIPCDGMMWRIYAGPWRRPR